MLFATALEDCLTVLGYKVCGRAAKGEVALTEIPGLNPDLVLMDIQLAGEINGIETAVRLRSLQDVPIIFLTAFSDDKMIRRVAAASQFGYLVKPFEEPTLHATLQAALYKHRTRQQLLSDEDRLEIAVQERTVRLSASEAHFRALFHSSPVASSLSDLATGEFLDVNPRFCQLCRRTREELVGHTSIEIGFWSDLRTTREKFRARLAATGRFTDFETSFVRPDGSLFHVSVSAEVIELDGRQVILSGFLDINDHKAAEAALRESEALLSSINASLPGSCVYRMLHRPDGRIDCVYISPTVEAIIGVPPAKIIADAAVVFDLLHPDDLPGFRRTLAGVLVSGATLDITIRAQHLGGEERWLQFRSRLVERRADGTQVRDGVVVDVTAIKATGAVNQQQAEFFTTLHQVTVELLGRHDQAELLQTIVDRCAGLFGATQVELDLVEGEVLVTRGFKGAAISRLGERATRQDAPLSWQAVDRGEPVVVHNYSKTARARTRYIELGLAATAIFPILHGRQCVGTLGIARQFPGRHFSPEEITQGLLFGQLAALVLHQAGIYEEARREAEVRTVDLHASEQRLNHALSATRDGVWDWNIPTGEVYYSPQWLRSLGYASAEVAPTFEFCKSIVHPDDLDRMLAAIQAHLEGKTDVYECENRIRTKSGVYRWNLDRGKIVERDAAGAPLRMVGTDTDITERKRADAVLRVNQTQLQVASQIARLGYWEYDVGQDLFHFNDQFYSILRTTVAREGGYTMPSARYAARFVDPQDGELVGVEIGKALATQDPDYRQELDHRVIFGDGQPGYIAVHIRVEKDPAGRTIRTRGAIVDITERKRAEHTVAESVALLRATLESTADGILTVKADGEIQSFNQTFLTMWRIPPEIIASRDDDRTIQFVLDQLRSPEQFVAKVQHLYAHPHEEGFDTLEFKDGRVFERYSRPMLVAGNPAGRVWSFRDVTERNRAEQALTLAHRHASVLTQLGRELSEAATPRTAALAILEAARLLVGWDCCWMHFWNERKQMFEDPVNFDLIDGERREIAPGTVYPCKPSTFMTRIIQEGPQLLLREKEDDNPGSLMPFGTMRRSLSLMFGRIQRGERLLGIVSIQSYQHHAYDQEALALLQSLADHCAGALIRIQARAELDASEERFRAVFERSPISIGLLTVPDGQLVEFNRACAEAFGYTREEAIGRTSVELGLWVDPAERDRYVTELRAKGHVSGFEARMRRKNGEIFIVLYSGSLIQIKGQTYGLNSLVDITGQRASEAALRGSEERFRLASQAVFDVIWDQDIRTSVIWWNERFQPLFGHNPQEAAIDGAFWRNCLHPDDQARVLAAVAAALAGRGKSWTDSYRFRRKDGTYAFVEDRAHIIRDTDGQPLRLIGAMRDVTEQKTAEIALRGSEELFRGVFEASPIPILLSAAPDGRITSANPAALRFFGYVTEEVLGRTSAELGLWVQPEQREEFFRRIMTEKTVSVFEAVLRTKSGEERNMLCTGTLIKLAGQVQVLSSAVDITTVRQFEAEQARIQQRLVQNQKFEALGTLAGGVAHDFNNLLAIISGYTEMSLNHSADPAKVRGNLQKIQHAALRASGLVQQILTFSRKHEVRYAPFDLNAQVRELVALLAETFPRTIGIVMDLEGKLPPLLADQSQVQQILLNLCVNARDAMPLGGTISVGTRLRSGTEVPNTPGVDPAKTYVCIHVTDTGAGITPAVRARLFEPFFTTKAVNKGTGLGLAVIYGIVTSHKGFIEVESTPGVGSTFIAGLPLSGETMTVSAIAAVRGFPEGTETLLVVDDEQSLQHLLEAAFTAKGYRVMTAATGLEAIDHLNRKDQPLDGLLLDLNMPGASGLEVARVAKLTRPGIKVLFLSGNMTTEVRTELEGLGFSAFMQKPYALDDIGRRLRTLLDHGK